MLSYSDGGCLHVCGEVELISFVAILTSVNGDCEKVNKDATQ